MNKPESFFPLEEPEISNSLEEEPFVFIIPAIPVVDEEMLARIEGATPQDSSRFVTTSVQGDKLVHTESPLDSNEVERVCISKGEDSRSLFTTEYSHSSGAISVEFIRNQEKVILYFPVASETLAEISIAATEELFASPLHRRTDIPARYEVAASIYNGSLAPDDSPNPHDLEAMVTYQDGVVTVQILQEFANVGAIPVEQIKRFFLDYLDKLPYLMQTIDRLQVAHQVRSREQKSEKRKKSSKNKR